MMITCKNVTELCTDFEEGALSWSDWASFRAHILMCGPCKEYVHQMKLTRQIISKVPPEDLSISVRTELAERFRSWHQSREED